MLIEDGYAHSLKTLLEKSRVEEMEFAARRTHEERFKAAHPVRIIGWVARLWTAVTPFTS